jgi:hypothetical protein
LTLRYAAKRPRPVIIGTGSARLEVGANEFRIGIASGPAEPDIFVANHIEDAALVIGGEGDGFLQTLLPSDGLVITFNFTAGFSQTRGFFLDGGAGLETTLGLHLEIGPVALELLHLGLRVDGEGAEPELSITASAVLGPIQASIERIE